MQITLCLDSKNWQYQFAKAPCKALAKLINRADKTNLLAPGETIYSKFLGLKTTQPISMAALHAAAWDVSGVYNAWLHADPVNIIPDQSNAFLIDRISLTDDETTLLLLDLNEFLLANDYVLFAPRPDQWLLNLAKQPNIKTVPVEHMFGSNIAEKLPIGEEEAHWRRVFTELQMLLHNHDVNLQRRAQKMATIDGLWFWGEGELPSLDATDWTGVWSDDEFVNGLCYLSNTPFEPLPAGFEEISEHLYPEGNYLFVISEKMLLNELERQWMQPLLNAINKKKIEQLQLIVNQKSYIINASKLNRWWRFAKPLSTVIKK